MSSKRVLVVDPTATRVQASSSLRASPPEDVQSQLLHVGMRVRKSVSEGYKQKGCFAPYESSAQAASKTVSVPGYVNNISIDENSVPKAGFRSHTMPYGRSEPRLKRRLREDEDESDSVTMRVPKVYYAPTRPPVMRSQDDFDDAPFLVGRDQVN